MKFLLKSAFWLSIVILLLPTAPSQRAGSASQVGTTEAVSAASAAVSDMRQFCSRQPDACSVGSQAIVQFGYKAQAAAKMLYDFLNERMGSEPTGSGVTGMSDKIAGAAPAKPSQNTLTPADLAPAWRGPQPHKDGAPRRPA